MRPTMLDADLLKKAHEFAASFLAALPERRVAPAASFEELVAALGGPLPEEGAAASDVVSRLARDVDPGLVASAGPRYFGFVIGGSLPTSLAADWLASAWDQNAGLCVTSPAAAAVEHVTASWILDLLGLPPASAVGFVTGCQMANATALAAARHHVLLQAGWNVEEDGMAGGPEIKVVVGAEAHVTILSSLRLLGLGGRKAIVVPADDQGRMRPRELRRILADCEPPSIVCAQAGNVNTGAFDPLAEIAEIAKTRGAWLHVDGAFGLWAAASSRLRSHLAGVSRADSWATDAHKWLNVPYDSGIVAVADEASLRSAMTINAPYLAQGGGLRRDPLDYVPESSRRARGFPIYAAMRSLGRRGIADLVERCCDLARRMASLLAASPGVKLLNEPVLNQVLVRFEPAAGGDADAFTRAVIARVQRDGTCWAGGTRWRGVEAMRISICNWSTTVTDIERSAEAILRAAREAAGGPSDPMGSGGEDLGR